MATKFINQLANMRGQIIRNVGKPKEANDALTWALPSYSTTDRDALKATGGMIIFNSSTNHINYYNGSSWVAL